LLIIKKKKTTNFSIFSCLDIFVMVHLVSLLHKPKNVALTVIVAPQDHVKLILLIGQQKLNVLNLLAVNVFLARLPSRKATLPPDT